MKLCVFVLAAALVQIASGAEEAGRAPDPKVRGKAC